MTGRTHLAAGIAAALAFVGPGTGSLAVACVVGGGLGGLVPDVDARASGQGRDARTAWIALAAIVAASLALDGVGVRALWDEVAGRIGLVQAASAMAFVGICMLGSLTPHRSFMHSALALAPLTLCVRVAFPTLATPFAIGFASHVALDLLNGRDVRVLYPLRVGFSLGLCRSGGAVDGVLFVACALTAICLLLRTPF